MLFELDRVTLQRGGKTVLQDVSASLPKGASCVAGPSGSGKSTRLRLLNRLADPGSGTVRYEGADVRGRDPLELRREVSLVPQLPALLGGTVEDNIRFAADLAGRAPEVPRLLDLAGLNSSFAERQASKLSVGEQQRVMLARCLALEPRVLLLDEPTAGLSPAESHLMARLLRTLDPAMTVLMIEHDMDIALEMAESVTVLHYGRVIADGPRDDVKADPLVREIYLGA